MRHVDFNVADYIYDTFGVVLVRILIIHIKLEFE